MQNSIPLLSNNDVAKFSQLFDRTANGSPFIIGEKAKEIFLKANLDNVTLGSIWSLVDRGQTGSLDKAEFIMAMHLLQLTLSKDPSVAPLPTTLSDQLWGSANGSAPSAPQSYIPDLNSNTTGTSLSSSTVSNINDWNLSADQKLQYDQIFDSLDTTRHGTLSSQVLVPFFLSSKLNQDTLAAVWDLSDINNNSDFTKVEFAIAMFLIQKKNAGVPLPDVLPVQLLHSQSLQNVVAPSQGIAKSIASPKVATTALSAAPIVAATVAATALPSGNKNTRANEELIRINNTKASIEAKLSSLRLTHTKNVKETEQLESSVNQIKRDVKALQQQLAMLEAGTASETTKVNELNQNFTIAQQKSIQFKQEIQKYSQLSKDLTNEISEKQALAKQESSMVDINTRQLELNHASCNQIQLELATFVSILPSYISKSAELNDHQKNVEEQHSALQAKYKELESKDQQLKDSELEMHAKAGSIEEREQEYESKIDRLQSLFEDLTKQKTLFEVENESLKNDHLDFANRMQDISERQMKLAVGEIPDDTEDFISKYNATSSSISKEATTEDDERTGSDVFDKDIPTVGSQSEGEQEDDPAIHINAAEALDDRFEGDLNEYRLPRTQSLTSSVANNPPLSVRDEVDVSETLSDVADLATDDTPNITQNRGDWEILSEATSGAIMSSNKDNDNDIDIFANISDFQSDSVKNPSQIASIDEEFPPIQELDIDESDSSDEDETYTETKPEPVKINFHSLEDEFADLEEAKEEHTPDATAVSHASFKEPLDSLKKISKSDTAGTLNSNKNLRDGNTNVGDDEWNQVFSGLGSNIDQKSIQQPVPTFHGINSSYEVPTINRKVATTPKSLAIEELSGMGFTEEESIEALKKSNWDLDSATNLLLDSA